MNNQKLVKLLMVGVSAMLLASCAGVSVDGEGGEAKTEPPHFYQHWVNSYEEQTNENVLFRPVGSMEFPPSRFRMSYIFNIDGSCQYKHLSANDAHRMESCVYTKVGNKVYIYDNAGKLIPDLSFTLTAPPSKDILHIKKGIQKPAAETKAGEKKEEGKNK